MDGDSSDVGGSPSWVPEGRGQPGSGVLGEMTPTSDRGVWSAEATRERSLSPGPKPGVVAKRAHPGRLVALVVLSGIAVIVVAKYAAPPISDWIESTSGTTTPLASTDPCEVAFRVAIAAGTRSARIETLQKCSAEQWIQQQAETPLEGETLRSLCDARFGLATDACAEADAERAAEANAARTSPESRTGNTANAGRSDSGAMSGSSPTPGFATPPVGPQQGNAPTPPPSYASPQRDMTQPARPPSPGSPGPSFGGAPGGTEPPGPSF